MREKRWKRRDAHEIQRRSVRYGSLWHDVGWPQSTKWRPFSPVLCQYITLVVLSQVKRSKAFTHRTTYNVQRTTHSELWPWQKWKAPEQLSIVARIVKKALQMIHHDDLAKWRLPQVLFFFLMSTSTSAPALTLRHHQSTVAVTLLHYYTVTLLHCYRRLALSWALPISWNSWNIILPLKLLFSVYCYSRANKTIVTKDTMKYFFIILYSLDVIIFTILPLFWCKWK